MDFRLTEKQAALQKEIREFIRQELTSELKQELEERALVYAGICEEPGTYSRELIRKIGAKGWLGAAWSKGYRGGGPSYMDQYIVMDEMAYHGLRVDYEGIAIVAPSIATYGSEEHKREYLPKIAAGEIKFCIGYTEPDFGSDLASVKTRAIADGDDYVVSGQKTFVSTAHYSDFCWLVARTDPEAPKHKGISLFIVPLRSSGITIRPLMNMAGFHHFDEIFFDGVRIPRENLVGEENLGWYRTTTALDFERSPILLPVSPLRRTLEWLLEYAKEITTNGHPLVRHRLAELAIEVEVAQLLTYRAVWMMDKGLIPNYEVSMTKLYTSELYQRIANTGMQLLGLHGQLESGSRWAPLKGRIEHLYLTAVSATILAGTSEIQRGVIARRGLGLPRQGALA